MNLGGLLWAFLCLWLAIHAVIFVLRAMASKKLKIKRWHARTPGASSQNILPIASNHASSSHFDWLNVEVGVFSVRLTTTTFNPLFQALYRLSPRFWNTWFNVGVWFGILAMIIGLLLLMVAGWRIAAFCLKILGSIISAEGSATLSASSKLVRRGFDDNFKTSAVEDPQVFVPVIPGVTLPLSHLGYYLISLLVSGIIHEAGHAVAAASELVPINGSGAFIIGLYPGAFVDLSSRSMSLLSPYRQLRVICAGVWHNFVLFALLWLALRGGLRMGFQLVGWRSLGGVDGVAVVNVSPTSPLHDHLPISSIIYRLDDTTLDNNIESWNSFLLRDSDVPALVERGFCANPQTAQQSLKCCEISAEQPFGRSENNLVSCFQRYQKKNTEMTNSLSDSVRNRLCFSTLEILTSNPPRARCESDTECRTDDETRGDVCVTPYTPYNTARVLRLYYRDWLWVDGSAEKIMVFVGEWVDVWESVHVSILQPRWSFLPVWLPGAVEITLSYMSSFTLALSVLNILPATQLDGQHAITCVLSMLVFRDEAISSANARLRHRIEKLIVSSTTLLIGFVIAGSLVLGIASAGSDSHL